VIRLNDRTFDVFLSEEEVLQQVRELGARLNREYANKDLVFLAILNGSFMFASDLLKQITVPCEVSFVKLSSYHGLNSRGEVNELLGINSDIRDKHLVILEDIVDTGLTIDKIHTLLEVHGAASVKVCSLLFKPDAFVGKRTPDFIGFSIPNTFVVGYGLDYNEKGRNLNAIYQLKES
jgi:hypoxanthine phosphoribosyltransferase